MHCRCERCRKVVEKRGGTSRAKAVFWGAWLFLVPWVAMLSCSGGAAFVIAPLTIALGCSIIAAFRAAAFPEPLCARCGASLLHAPVVELEAPASQPLPVPARLAPVAG